MAHRLPSTDFSNRRPVNLLGESVARNPQEIRRSKYAVLVESFRESRPDAVKAYDLHRIAHASSSTRCLLASNRLSVRLRESQLKHRVPRSTRPECLRLRTPYRQTHVIARATGLPG